MLEKLYRNGVKPEDDALTSLRTILVNLILIFGVPIVFCYAYSYSLLGTVLFSLTFFCCGILYLYCFYLNNKRKFASAKNLVITLSILLIFFVVIQYGRGGEGETVFVVLGIFIFILFDTFIQRAFHLIFLITAFLSSFLYVHFNGPLQVSRPFEYDFIINFGFVIFASTYLSYVIIKTIQGNISAREKAIDSLQRKNLELATKNQVIQKQKEEMELFTSMASHDLKTPVRTINSFLGLLEKKLPKTDEKTNQYLEEAISGSLQLNELITGISDYKQLEEDQDTSRFISCIETIMLVKQNLKFDEDVRLSYSDLPTLKINRSHLYHLFQNLIENAIKYNKQEQKEIDISHSLNKDHIQIEFRDNGIGIEKEYLDYIFEPFKKLHGTSDYKSTGLGLSICKKIVSLYNGEITAKNAEPKGTILTVTLPLSMVETV